jgi:NADH:ubiquinone oxidoreductase subunit 6 (subunit J)
MPVTILAGLLFVLIAFVMYSLGAWGAFRKKGTTKSTLRFLWIGFVFDVLATTMMAIQPTAAVQANLATNPSFYLMVVGLGSTSVILLNNFSTYVSLLAMVGMLAAAIFSTIALRSGDAGKNMRMSRVVLAPWALWAVAFVLGILGSMPKR